MDEQHRGAEKSGATPEGESAVGRLAALLARYGSLADMCLTRALPSSPQRSRATWLGFSKGSYATGVGKPSALGPAFSFKASVNSCKLETICGALVNTAEASFSA
jgi:hypothetical protein